MRFAYAGSAWLLAAACGLASCGSVSDLPRESGYGASPVLPAPDPQLIPTVRVPTATGWPAGAQPTPSPGLRVQAFAQGLDHPRWLYVLPNGDVLVAETNAPPKEGGGIKAFFMKLVMKKAGAAVPSANRITLLRDANGDGVADVRSTFLENLNSPFGMQLIGSDLYVANTDAILRFAYTPGATRITSEGSKLADLPAGPINHHWTKNILASADGKLLYATVGSNSDHAEKGMAAEERRAAILQIDVATGGTRLFASGLRNPNGMGWEPHTGVLWTVVNERDALGNNLVPDYLTSVREGGFYGWPYSYYGQHLDPRVKPQRPDLVQTAIAPDYAVGAHTAPLGMVFSHKGVLLPRHANGVFIGQHGSWNRKPPSGYRVIFVPFANGRPAGAAEEVLGGFLSADDKALGRPVGVAIDSRGALLVADDVGNVVWRVSADE